MYSFLNTIEDISCELSHTGNFQDIVKDNNVFVQDVAT